MAKKRNPGGCLYCCGSRGLHGSLFALFGDPNGNVLEGTGNHPTWFWNDFNRNYAFARLPLHASSGWGWQAIGFDHDGLRRDVFCVSGANPLPGSPHFVVGDYPAGSIVIISMRDMIRAPVSASGTYQTIQIPKFTRMGASFDVLRANVGVDHGVQGTWHSMGVDYATRRLYGFGQYTIFDSVFGINAYWRIGSCSVDDGSGFQWHTPPDLFRRFPQAAGFPGQILDGNFATWILWSRHEQRPVIVTNVGRNSGGGTIQLLPPATLWSFEGNEIGQLGPWDGTPFQNVSALSDFVNVFGFTHAGPSSTLIIDPGAFGGLSASLGWQDVACFTPEGPIILCSAIDDRTGIRLIRPFLLRGQSLYGFRLRLNGGDVCDVRRIQWDEVGGFAVAMNWDFHARLDIEKAGHATEIVEAAPNFATAQPQIAQHWTDGRCVLLPKN